VGGVEGKRLHAYEVMSKLGSGGMGSVYLAEVGRRARGLDQGQRVALKVVHPHLFDNPGIFKRFMREADIGRRISHPNVVRTLDVDAERVDGHLVHYLVMEYVEGQTLRQLLTKLERVPEALAHHIGLEIARALQAIHETGVVHRDLKPENVLITSDETIKVMDLGVARLIQEANRLSTTGHFVGSPLYAAPEQFTGEDIDGRADLYALGLTLYELVSGRHPFEGISAPAAIMHKQMTSTVRPVSELNAQVSPFFEEVLKTLLAKDKKRRFPSAAALAELLEQGDRSPWWSGRAKSIRAETQRPLRRIRISRETPLHGRARELKQLREFYDLARGGTGQVVLVEGEAGIGKSRLIDEFVFELQQEGEDLNFLFGGYRPGGAATPTGAFSNAYRDHFGNEELEESLRDALPDLPLLVPAFAALLKGEPTREGVEPLTRDSVQTVFVSAARSLASQRPTIVLIDDLHFAPEEGRALFAALAMAVPDHRILLIGGARPGMSKSWVSELDRPEHTTRLTLDRLGPKDLLRLLEDAFDSLRLAKNLYTKISLKSDGNPFFVFEIVAGLKEGRYITKQVDGTWTQR